MEKENIKKGIIGVICGIAIVIVIFSVSKALSRDKEIIYFNDYEIVFEDTCFEEFLLEDDEIGVIINGHYMLIDLSSDEIVYNPAMMTTEFENTFSVCDLNGYDVSIDDISVNDGDVVSVNLTELSVDNYISINVSNSEFEETYLITTLHEKIDYTVSGEGDLYYYFDYNDAAVKTDNLGNPLTFIMTDFIRDFRKYEFDGKTYYSYLERAQEYDNIDVVGAAHMRLIITNDKYQEIDRVEYLISGDDIINNHSIENHEYQVLGLGHYIVSAYSAQDVDNVPSDYTSNDDGTASVVAAVFQEINDGELVFEFISSDYPEFYELSTDRNDFGNEIYQDYMHQNSIFIDPSDDNYIVSFRSLDSVVKIDRTTGEIIWILGGEGDMFGIKTKQRFSRQHFATISIDGTLTIYDNGVSSEQSRILEFTLDEENLTIESLNKFSIDGYYGSIRGSVIRTNSDEDIFLTAWGFTQSNKAIMTEYNFTTDEKIIEFYDNTGDVCRNYRIRKYES